MTNGLKLFLHLSRYDLLKTELLFFSAIMENMKYHIAACPEYAGILAAQGFSLDMLRSIDDLYKIPPIPTLFLKSHTLYSTPDERLIFKSTTSGTGGKPSLVGLDWPTARRGLGMVAVTFFTHKLFSVFPTNYVLLGYEPAKRNKMGVVKTMYANTFAAPALHREYALKDNGSEYILNIDGIKDALIKYQKQGHRVRFIGFPAYFMFLLKDLQESGIRLRLHPKSIILLAGGWKQFFAQKIEKNELYELSKEVLGLGGDCFKEIYSVIEHPIIYADCSCHHFHVPVYSRVIIRDINSFKPVDYGVPGIINLITPMITSMPFTSIMTDDIAIVHRGEECGCGIKSPFFEILGRAGLEDIKTCAANAAEMLTVTKHMP